MKVKLLKLKTNNFIKSFLENKYGTDCPEVYVTKYHKNEDFKNEAYRFLTGDGICHTGHNGFHGCEVLETIFVDLETFKKIEEGFSYKGFSEVEVHEKD